MRIHCAILWLFCAGALAAQSSSPSPSSSPAASESPAATIAQSVAELSAQRAAADRSKIYRAGAAYGRWLDQLAEKSGNTFLQRQVFDRVTWMRLVSCAVGLALLSLLSGWLIWIVRRHAGEIGSTRYQSWLALSAAAIRKPVALFLWVCGGAFALLPIAAGIVDRPTRIFWGRLLTAIFYAGWIIALLWLVFRAIRVVEKRMRMWAERTRSLLGKIVVPIVGHTLRLSVPLLGIILLLPVLKLPENWTWVTQKAIGILFIVALSFLIIHGINTMQGALLSRQRLDSPDNLSARRIYTQVSVIRKVIITAIVVIAAGSVLMLFDPVRQFGTSILASAGIAGIVIGFAAQRTLGNVLAGIQIALTQPLLIDDIVVVEGEFGQIEEITLTYVTVRTWDLRRMILPITYFVEKPFQNWSRISTDLLGTIMLYLDYRAPIGELRKELKRLVENNSKWDRKVCGLQVTDTKQNTIEVRALVSGTDPGKVFDLRCEVREGLIEYLCRNHPESLPRQRNVNEISDDEIQRGHKQKVATTPPGQEHERGPKAPGIHAELKSDGVDS
ncbi:MAG: mechanosensitive ion channel [Verrucomicrobia bacterium]|nr:mechanosensitive ion channel [Verrucomicrobiota bacterium]